MTNPTSGVPGARGAVAQTDNAPLERAISSQCVAYGTTILVSIRSSVDCDSCAEYHVIVGTDVAWGMEMPSLSTSSFRIWHGTPPWQVFSGSSPLSDTAPADEREPNCHTSRGLDGLVKKGKRWGPCW